MDKENVAYIQRNTIQPLKRNTAIYKQHSEPEGIIIPNEISQTRKDKYRIVSLICGI